MRILTLFVRYGTEKYRDAHSAADEIVSRTFPGVDRRTILIDNAEPAGTMQFTEDARTLIGGDNTFWEFSAWDQGIRFVGDDIWSYDYVQLVTSAFGELHTAYLDRFSERMLAACADRPIVIGHVDCFNTPVAFRGFVSQHWIRSSYFFVRPVEVKSLGSFVSLRHTTSVFTGDPSQPFQTDAPIDAAWRHNITSWLTGDGTGQGISWHSRFDLTAETLPYFERKTQAILNEHLLSIRLRALGCRLADATWLASAIGQNGWKREIPCWQDQLKMRDQDRVIVPERD